MSRNPGAPFILASASPRRRRLMAVFPWKTRVIPSRAHEPRRRPSEKFAAYARRLALIKARAVAKSHPDALVLGADTIVVFGGKSFGKPKDPRDAARMLTALQGRWHRVYTGLALVAGGRFWTGTWRTEVRMRALDERFISRQSRRHLDKAGGYAAQAKGNPFVEDYRGDFDTVIGLPRRGVRRLLAKARRAGWRPV